MTQNATSDPHHPSDKISLSCKCDIIIEDERWHNIDRDLEKEIGDLLEYAVTQAPVIYDLPKHTDTITFSVCLADDTAVRALNAQFRNKDNPTNVLSFPALGSQNDEFSFVEEEECPYIGDIILSYDTLLRESTEQTKNIKDHTYHLVLHGFLHIAGYSHDDDKQAEIMENLEIKILSHFHIQNPYSTITAK